MTNMVLKEVDFKQLYDDKHCAEANHSLVAKYELSKFGEFDRNGRKEKRIITLYLIYRNF